MSAPTAKPVIFISYSHQDEPKTPGPKDQCWLSFVQSHLQPAVKHGMYDLWVDEDIPAGGTWRAEITRKLDECDVCVLLVSRHSLASDFIIDVEIETLRKRREKGEAEIFPIVLTPCAVTTAPWIREINLRPPNGQPLSDFEENERHRQMATIAEEIAGMAEKIAGKKVEQAATIRTGATPTIRVITPPPAIDAGAGAAEEQKELEAKRTEDILVDTADLPETAYERLVGRETELKKLDDAWSAPNINIVSLIAEGGAGKSALVNEWLGRLQADKYRGAAVVLGWSFYSQGSKERATSAEQFLTWALDKLGIKLETTSAPAKGEAIAEAMMQRRVLLLLDGVEPLQHGPGPQIGQLKDFGLRALMRRFAATPPGAAHGLVVLTSRLQVADIARWRDDAAPAVDVDRLSDEAGAALLRDNGVWGTDKELKVAAHDFGGHPLGLALLASFLKDTQTGDVRRRDRIRAFLADPENPRHDHAARVMESYEKEWLADQPVLHAIMHMVGLFDRPASGDCLAALRAAPAIDGLTDRIVTLDENAWRHAVARLREARLLAPADPNAPGALDAHPLVREWFGERLQQTNEAAWKAAHGRLYEHLRDTTKEGKAPILDDLAPLYQAIAHGCRANRHQEALDDVLANRIYRRRSDGRLEGYSVHKLGAVGSDLAALFWFFGRPYNTPVATLKESDRAWVLGEAAFHLRGQGRFAEALPATRAALRMTEAAGHWSNSAANASNLSETELLVGEISAAVATAERAVFHADRSGDKFQMMVTRGTQAYALHSAGDRGAAGRLYADTERRQKEEWPGYPLLFSLRGYLYCDLLLATGEHAVVRERATTILQWEIESDSLLERALVRLSLARAYHGLGLRTNQIPAGVRRDGACTAHSRLDQCIDGLRATGQSDYTAHGLLARAAFRRDTGDWDGAARDLDEVEEIAEPGPMRLYLCDMALGRARLAFARIEAFAPLNGMLERDNPPKPAVPSSEEIAQLKAEAEKQVATAAKLIETCGYHRRDEELAELKAVLAGEKTFADLPPRV